MKSSYWTVFYARDGTLLGAHTKGPKFPGLITPDPEGLTIEIDGVPITVEEAYERAEKARIHWLTERQ